MANTIVTYRNLQPILSGAGKEFELKRISETTKASAASDGDAAANLASFWAAIHALERVDTGDVVMSTPQDRVASLLQTYLAEQSEKEGKIRPSLSGRHYEAKFDSNDLLGWIGGFFQWWRKIVPHPWWPPPTSPTVLSGPVRTGVLADWGTGLYGAPECAKTLQSDAVGFDIYLHLGDVYYSGTPEEVRERFLASWPTNPRRFSRALNSNHEMYGGGWGLFDETLKTFGQSSSCFWIELDRYVLVGLDSAYAEHDLANAQDVWLRQIISQSGNKKIVLFSHHQPYSLLDAQGPKLIEKIGDLMISGKIFAWYWGHEHRLAIYDRHPAYHGMYGRCLGHGGMPYFRDTLPGMGGSTTSLYRTEPHAGMPGAWFLDGPNPYMDPGERDRYGPNGYMTLAINGDQWIEEFFLPDGKPIDNSKKELIP